MYQINMFYNVICKIYFIFKNQGKIIQRSRCERRRGSDQHIRNLGRDEITCKGGNLELVLYEPTLKTLLCPQAFAVCCVSQDWALLSPQLSKQKPWISLPSFRDPQMSMIKP